MPSVHPVVVTVVLGLDLETFPSHVEDGDERAEFVMNGDLGGRRREAAADQEQP